MHDPDAGAVTRPSALHEDRANATQAKVIGTQWLDNGIKVLLAVKVLQGAQNWLFRVASVMANEFTPYSTGIPAVGRCSCLNGGTFPIGEWVLRRACQDAAGWQSAHKVAVNLSPIQFAHADIKGLVEDVLRATKLDPKRLELEITDSSIIVDKERAMAALTSLKTLGVSIAIDDFGTGYSSLDTLRSFPFDKIKLDRSFMTDLDSTSGSRAMIRAALAMGHGLNIPILAEGVETSDQLEILRVEGCHEVQGYLLGRPGPMNVAQSEAA